LHVPLISAHAHLPLSHNQPNLPALIPALSVITSTPYPMSPHCHPRSTLTIPSPGLTLMSSHLFHLSSNPTSRSPSAGAVPLTHVPLLCHYRSISPPIPSTFSLSPPPFPPSMVPFPHHPWSLSPITPTICSPSPPSSSPYTVHSRSIYPTIPSILELFPLPFPPFVVPLLPHPRSLSTIIIPNICGPSLPTPVIPLPHHPRSHTPIIPTTCGPFPTSFLSLFTASFPISLMLLPSLYFPVIHATLSISLSYAFYINFDSYCVPEVHSDLKHFTTILKVP